MDENQQHMFCRHCVQCTLIHTNIELYSQRVHNIYIQIHTEKCKNAFNGICVFKCNGTHFFTLRVHISTGTALNIAHYIALNAYRKSQSKREANSMNKKESLVTFFFSFFVAFVLIHSISFQQIYYLKYRKPNEEKRNRIPKLKIVYFLEKFSFY